jgi:predicted amidophosphoribosyltransferase
MKDCTTLYIGCDECGHWWVADTNDDGRPPLKCPRCSKPTEKNARFYSFTCPPNKADKPIVERLFLVTKHELLTLEEIEQKEYKRNHPKTKAVGEVYMVVHDEDE